MILTAVLITSLFAQSVAPTLPSRFPACNDPQLAVPLCETSFDFYDKTQILIRENRKLKVEVSLLREEVRTSSVAKPIIVEKRTESVPWWIWTLVGGALVGGVVVGTQL